MIGDGTEPRKSDFVVMYHAAVVRCNVAAVRDTSSLGQKVGDVKIERLGNGENTIAIDVDLPTG